MAKVEIRKAERMKSKLRLAIAGPSGSGKTYGGLKLARGIGGKVCLIDTERGSGDLYADLYDYDIISLEPPFKPDVLIEAIRAAEDANYDVIVIDSLSHFWSDEGGLLDQADKMQAAGKNRFTLWADITPQHRRLVNTMLNSSKHIIATMRSKQEYAMEKDEKTGHSTVKKLGMAPVQREGMEYEFTIFFDVDQGHNARASKDRTSMFNNEIFMLDENIGKKILNWLNTGKTDVKGMKKELISILRDRLELGIPKDQADAAEFIRSAVKKLTGFEWKEENLEGILKAIREVKDQKAAYQIVWGSTTTSENAPGEAKTVAPAQSTESAAKTATAPSTEAKTEGKKDLEDAL